MIFVHFLHFVKKSQSLQIIPKYFGLIRVFIAAMKYHD